MIKRKDITCSNIDSYIRQEKRILNDKSFKMYRDQRFYWNKREWSILVEFVAILNYKLEEGMIIMGTKHYLQKI